MNTKERVKKLDKYLRNKSGITANDFVATYCKVLADYAYATRDGSINEMEKTLTHVLGMLIYYKRFCEILGFEGKDGDKFDPRDFVCEYEDAVAERKTKQSKQLNKIMADIITQPCAN